MSRQHGSGGVEAPVGERVRSRRIQAGMSQTTFGKALAVTFQQIQEFEKGVNRFVAGPPGGCLRSPK